MTVLSLFIGALLYLAPFQSEKLGYQPDYKAKSQSAITFIKANNMDTTACLLFDTKIHSGKKRLVVWNYLKDTIAETMVCTHGIGGAKGVQQSSAAQPIFSNIESSHASSIGKYRIGDRGWSNWGINVNYKLHGLEKTNSNAFKRYIVLHSWTAVSQEEVYPNASPFSWGCPAVSDEDMRTLDKLLKTKKNVLLWIYH